MGDEMTPDLVVPMLRRRHGVHYLPAGHRLGHIGAPEIPQHILEKIIDHLSEHAGRVVICPCAQADAPPTVIALRRADVVVVPFSSQQELEVIREQVADLFRVGLMRGEIVELFWQTPGVKVPRRVFGRRIGMSIDLPDRITPAEKQSWQDVCRRIAAGRQVV
jgi:predicted DNA-binding transcriptional regulator